MADLAPLVADLAVMRFSQVHHLAISCRWPLRFGLIEAGSAPDSRAARGTVSSTEPGGRNFGD